MTGATIVAPDGEETAATSMNGTGEQAEAGAEEHSRQCEEEDKQDEKAVVP